MLSESSDAAGEVMAIVIHSPSTGGHPPIAVSFGESEAPIQDAQC